MGVFQICVLENEANIPSSTCWNCLWTLWSHLILPSPEWQQAPLRQPAEVLSASIGCPACRTQTKSRSSHSSGLQKPSWGQRAEYRTGGWRDIFGPNSTLPWRPLQMQWQYSKAETRFPPEKKLPHSCCDRHNYTPSQGQGSSDADSSHHLPSCILLYHLCVPDGSLFSLSLHLGEGWGYGSVCTPRMSDRPTATGLRSLPVAALHFCQFELGRCFN